jgi:hypothetical protein
VPDTDTILTGPGRVWTVLFRAVPGPAHRVSAKWPSILLISPKYAQGVETKNDWPSIRIGQNFAIPTFGARESLPELPDVRPRRK